MERIERSEGGHILRNQQVSGSSPELAPSISIIHTVPRGTAGASWPYPLRGCGRYRFLRRQRAHTARQRLSDPAAVLKAEALYRYSRTASKRPAFAVCASPREPPPPSLRALAEPVWARPTPRRDWRSAPCRGRKSRRGLRLREACWRPVPASPVESPCPR